MKALVKFEVGVLDYFIQRGNTGSVVIKRMTGLGGLITSTRSLKPRQIFAKLTSWKTKEMIAKKARQIRRKGVVFYNELSQRT